jgi:hypothetical protein
MCDLFEVWLIAEVSKNILSTIVNYNWDFLPID